ncbi:zinc ribbon domain-containing protein [bacterium]|nr:zinc ribbon domain-containing protein [bacterium]
MPIFEYRCEKCNHQFEELVFSRHDVPPCPSCGHEKVEKQLSTFGVNAGNTSPCGSGECCSMPEAPACGSGGCPSCM